MFTSQSRGKKGLVGPPLTSSSGALCVHTMCDRRLCTTVVCASKTRLGCLRRLPSIPPREPSVKLYSHTPTGSTLCTCMQYEHATRTTFCLVS